MSAMKFCRVIVELVQMNRRGFVVGRDGHIPLSRELAWTSFLIWSNVVGNSVRVLRVWNDFVGHPRIMH